MNNISFIGMAGCGKSTIGEAVSTKLGISFVDTDSVSYTHLTLPTKA